MRRILSLLVLLCLLAACGTAGAESPALSGKPWINSNVYGNWPSVTEGTPMYIAPEDRVLPW